MKKIIISIVATVCMLPCYALDIVQLNNGRVIKGNITNINEGVSLTIKSENGFEYTYPIIEVKSYNQEEIAQAPSVLSSKGYHDYNFYNRGFWASAEAEGGYLLSRQSNGGYGELHFVAGYRLCEYLKVGAGFGARYYINNKEMRSKDYKWSFPLFLNVRGNIIPELNRNVVPFYSAEFGSAINDGIYFRPSIGIRIGEPRGAFILAISYMAQKMKVDPERKQTASFIGLKTGWEF